MATFSTLFSFNSTSGTNPTASLLRDANGDLFGTTSLGGANSDDGTVFEIAKTASGYASAPTILLTFNQADGSEPQGNLIADSAGNLFGTTHSEFGSPDQGTVFEIVKTASGYAGTPTTLASFNGSNGAGPVGGLVADAAGNLYGTTSGVGSLGVVNDGTVFEIAKTPTGYASTPTTLASFNGTDGSGLFASLYMDAAGNLFGGTAIGGASNDGVIFEIAKTATGYASAPTVLVSFNGADGIGAEVPLIADAAGDLFGTTTGLFGPTHTKFNDGTVLEIVKTATGYASTPTTLVSFNGADGSRLDSGLLMDANGNLFGMTPTGGANGHGTIYEIAKTAGGYASTPTTLHDFTGFDGDNASGGLIADSAGNLYGTTNAGGANSQGTVFELSGTGFQVARLSVATALSDFSAGHLAAGTAISDSASAVQANLAGLQQIAAAGDLGSIALTNSGTSVIGVTAAQLTSDAAVLHGITSSYALSIDASAANLTIAGINAQDTAVFTGNAGQYTVAATGQGTAFTVTDTATGRTSVDTLSNVEFLQFADRMVFVATPAEAQIALLYQGVLGRTPDAPGLVSWQNAFATEPAAAQGADDFTALAGTPVAALPDLAYGFTQSTEFQTKYGSLTDAQFVTQLYANVLDRTPDSAGLNGWVGALAQGHTREWVLVGFVESSEAYHNAEVGYVGQTGTVHAPWLTVV